MHTNWGAVTHGSTWRKCLQMGVDEEGINAKTRRGVNHERHEAHEMGNAKTRRGKKRERGIRGRMKSGGIEREGKI